MDRQDLWGRASPPRHVISQATETYTSGIANLQVQNIQRPFPRISFDISTEYLTHCSKSFRRYAAAPLSFAISAILWKSDDLESKGPQGIIPSGKLKKGRIWAQRIIGYPKQAWLRV